MNDTYLSKKEQEQLRKTIKMGMEADKRLRDYSDKISSERDNSLYLLKQLREESE